MNKNPLQPLGAELKDFLDVQTPSLKIKTKVFPSKEQEINFRNSDRGATNPSNDPLHEIGGSMPRSKTKRME